MMKGITSVILAVLMTTAIGGVSFSDSPSANQADLVIAQQRPSPRPTTPTPRPTPTPRR
ncbi:hypothetical protein IQ244_01530 [Nostoc sp. LEGE 06077]|uniref:hypothetical protein n=1 Tax=Nostoc sp. LEGE 06077 TaxID=915325 RepID=UPI00188201A3|nr:hypothetical protein [Nostoc sp. LEGE 06077]MBE9205234.1 hypothetical protein [Nostoc sp. LEGE 06077]